MEYDWMHASSGSLN